MDEATHREVEALLARADNRYTAGRRHLVELVGAAGRPVTMPDVLASDPELSQSSVYRNLDVLERSGVIVRLATGGEHTYYELSEPLLGHHHHLICVECGSVQDVELDHKVEVAVDEALAKVASAVAFQPLHHSLDLHGYCKACS